MSAGNGSYKASATDISILLLIGLGAIVVCLKIFMHGVMYAADDIWWHMLWLKDFIGELNEGILYPRWLAHSHYLYGSPVLVFYPPFCFFAGAAISKVFSLPIMQTSTMMLAASAFGSGTFFYLCGRDRWGKLPAGLGALMITTSPYLTVDIYVRGAMGELFAFSWLPLVLLSVDQVHLRRGKILLSLGFCLTALTHLPSLLIFGCAWLLRLAGCSVRTAGGVIRIRDNILYASLGLGCAAFFLLPVLIERRYVNIDAIRAFEVWKTNLFFYPDFRGFFMLPSIAIKSSLLALILTWLTGAQRAGLTTFKLRWNEPLQWLFLNLLSLFLMSKLSYWIWHYSVPLQFLQYPWRWMMINVFTTAVLSAICLKSLVQSASRIYFKSIVKILFLAVLVQNLATDFFITRFRSGLDNPETFIIENQSALALGEFGRYNMPAVLRQNEGYAGVPEYTPLGGIDCMSARRILPRTKPEQPLFKYLSGAGIISATRLGAYERLFSVDAYQPMKVLFRTYYYPGWHLYVDGLETSIEQGADGEILITAAKGRHDYRLVYEDTTAFKLGLFLSFVSGLLLASLVWRSSTRSSAPRSPSVPSKHL